MDKLKFIFALIIIALLAVVMLFVVGMNGFQKSLGETFGMFVFLIVFLVVVIFVAVKVR